MSYRFAQSSAIASIELLFHFVLPFVRKTGFYVLFIAVADWYALVAGRAWLGVKFCIAGFAIMFADKISRCVQVPVPFR